MKPGVDTAVILAAGQGNRLRSAWADRPKGFISLGEQPIVEESVRRLLAASLQDIVIVTGYEARHYEALAGRYAGRIRTVHNATFASSGSMYSLYRARHTIGGDFLLLESDLIYEPRALDLLLGHAAADVILVSGPTGAGDEVYVEAAAGRLVNMAKDRARLGPAILGEFVGISRISMALYTRMLRIAAAAFERSLRFDYESDCLVAAAAEQRIDCLLVDDLLWGEIDDPAHLARARSTVYPAIQAAAALRRVGS